MSELAEAMRVVVKASVRGEIGGVEAYKRTLNWKAADRIEELEAQLQQAQAENERLHAIERAAEVLMAAPKKHKTREDYDHFWSAFDCLVFALNNTEGGKDE